MGPVDVGRLADRLRARSVSSWTPERVALTRAALQDLADLAADAAGEPGRVVPALHPTALADQLVVLVDDSVRAGVDPAETARLLAELAEGLAVR